MLNLTIEQVDAAIAKIEHAFPSDHKYAEKEDNAVCYYAFDLDRPGCIVGWIIWHIDVGTFGEIAANPEWNGASVQTLVNYGVIGVEGGHGGPLFRALGDMQHAQDQCMTWGEAIAIYRKRLASLLATA